MHTITLTQNELRDMTDALDATLIEFEKLDGHLDFDPEMNARYDTLKSLYIKLFNRQFGIK
jgi:hypothetical protein